jgi:hypothetical protein
MLSIPLLHVGSHRNRLSCTRLSCEKSTVSTTTNSTEGRREQGRTLSMTLGSLTNWIGIRMRHVYRTATAGHFMPSKKASWKTSTPLGDSGARFAVRRTQYSIDPSRSDPRRHRKKLYHAGVMERTGMLPPLLAEQRARHAATRKFT